MLDASSASGDLVVNLANAAFVLNPGADLRHTSSHFTPLLNDNSEHLGWKGTAGRIPSEEEMRQALSQRDLFLCVWQLCPDVHGADNANSGTSDTVAQSNTSVRRRCAASSVAQ